MRKATNGPLDGEVFEKEFLIKGQAARTRCFQAAGQVFVIEPGPVRIIRLEDEWYEDVKCPEKALQLIRSMPAAPADLFTFWQRLPNITPQFSYHVEFEDIAVLPIESYKKWWTTQINAKSRNRVRKASKDGVVVRRSSYDDNFVSGMTKIFNEAPMRQGRRFWHFGKDFETVKRQFSRYLHREEIIGAYFKDEMIGFMMIGDAGRFALLGQIVSSLMHRDKSPNNAMIAAAVQNCAERGFPSLVYYFWSEDSLADFKRHCGFQRVRVPRYYVPLTRKGELALRIGLHRGWSAMLPPRLKRALKRARASWYSRHGS